MIALLSMTLTASAQAHNDAQVKAVMDFVRMFRPVGKDFAVTAYPVTWRTYTAVTGKKKPANTSLTAVVSLSQSEQKAFANYLTKGDGQGIKYRVATASELQKALSKRINIQSESGPNNVSTKGFYIAVSYKDYQKLKAVLDVVGDVY